MPPVRLLPLRRDPVLITAISAPIRAGFPSPAADHEEERIDLARLLVQHPAATFMMRVAGDSMREHRIHDGDVVVVDRSIPPRDGLVVAASVDGEYTLKLFRRQGRRIWLEAGNPAYPAIEISESAELVVFGVVTSATTLFDTAIRSGTAAHRRRR